MKNFYFSTLYWLFVAGMFYIIQPNLQAQTLVDFETDSALFDGTVVINDAYSLPEDAGSAGEVMMTNGSGQAEWMSLPSAPAVTGTYVYMTPYVCGHIDLFPFPVIDDRNEGQYQTAISISNPAHGSASITRHITHTHDVAGAIPPDSIRAPEPAILLSSLDRFHSFAMTCEEIYDMLGTTPVAVTPIYEGYVIVESDEKLAVSATYTYYDVEGFVEPVNQGGAGGLGIGTSIDVHHIEPIFVPSPAE